MNVNQMRREIERMYSKKFADKMSDTQIVAMYISLQRRGKIR